MTMSNVLMDLKTKSVLGIIGLQYKIAQLKKIIDPVSPSKTDVIYLYSSSIIKGCQPIIS
jgi:hypothetical protein